jgi:hypothetical protein
MSMKRTRQNSVLQDWVMELPLREQGTILTAIRGCDLTPKYPMDSPERQIVGWIRYAVLNPADPREVGIKGAFFQSEMPDFKLSAFGHYPLHWFVHIMHTLEVIGYRSTNRKQKRAALIKYHAMVRSLHLKPEEEGEMKVRLSEDRIANDTVVS